ncbi:unnamed protein product [Ambrosiozyma monospora]|uniref:Transcription initiation factor TFIID subunit 4 n=1 Tax=Ambrosiozyma monospora TaxID=43982 RepID=A0A9W7DHX8_AMBMO|nr:unnamed protein product [Ambrosiozyma monospora]
MSDINSSNKRLLDEDDPTIAELLNGIDATGTKRLKMDDSLSKSGSPAIDLGTPNVSTPTGFSSASPPAPLDGNGGLDGLTVEDLLSGDTFFSDPSTPSLLDNNTNNSINNINPTGSLVTPSFPQPHLPVQQQQKKTSPTPTQAPAPVQAPTQTQTAAPVQQQQQQSNSQRNGSTTSKTPKITSSSNSPKPPTQPSIALPLSSSNNSTAPNPMLKTRPTPNKALAQQMARTQTMPVMGTKTAAATTGPATPLNKNLKLKETKSTSNLTRRQPKPANKSSQQNPEELADAVAAAGVNIRAEEEALISGLSVSKKQLEPNNFLKPQQLAWFMNRVMEEQGLKLMDVDPELMNIMSVACENYMSNIVTDTIIMSRHRRVPLKTKHKQSVGSSKSEISKALRDIATKQKEREERRVKKRIALGLEEEKKDEEIAEEHKQTNVTASLMMGGSKKKKYSWMQSGSSRSNSINARGDNGIRYREARQEPGIVLRDLMSAIENRRMGVRNTIVKGYSKMRD